ncbi:muscarinic acetylcholine receptor M4-like [Lytechinus pictus]|uniref:muscarinic acetylcholine receptor M4-like n=1 Tax=Lytechinus pictus TaxID=7653 RepID=UPI0030BA0BC8
MIPTMEPLANITVNVSAGDEEPTQSFSLATITLAAIAAGFASLFTVAGNLLVIIAFARERRLRIIGNYFVLSMAVADSLVGLISMPFYTTYLLLGRWPMGPHVCDVWLSLDYVCCAASVLGIFLISVDRYRSLSAPMTYRHQMTRPRAMALILATWVISLLLFGVPIIGWQYIEGKRTVKEDQCEVQFVQNAYFTAGSIILIYWLPLFVILVLYTRIYLLTRKLTRRQARIIGRLSMRTKKKRRSRTETNVTMTDVFPSRTENGTHRVSGPTDSDETPQDPDHYIPDTASSEMGKEFDIITPLPQRCNSADESDEFDVNSNGGDKTPDNYNKKANWATSMRSDNHSVYSDCDAETHPMKRPNSCSSLNSDRRGLKSAMSNFKHKDHHLGKALSSVLVNLREAKAVRTLSTILGFFILCWTPYSILIIVKGFCDPCVNDSLFAFTYFLCYINSTCNPLCYAFANRDFKVAFKKILTCGRRRYEWKDVF